jgi:hypothetical protein
LSSPAPGRKRGYDVYECVMCVFMCVHVCMYSILFIYVMSLRSIEGFLRNQEKQDVASKAESDRMKDFKVCHHGKKNQGACPGVHSPHSMLAYLTIFLQ